MEREVDTWRLRLDLRADGYLSAMRSKGCRRFVWGENKNWQAILDALKRGGHD